MKKVYLDTNIMLDYLEQRCFSENAKIIFKLSKKGKFLVCASLLSFVNIAYIRRKHSVDEIYADLSCLRSIVSVVPIDDVQLDNALNVKIKDFEDNIQFQCAKAAGCDVIVTNNTKDFAGLNGIDVMSSEEFLLDLFADEEV
ncbi:MAG: PIN domain-containing protein [Bacteroidales bacterium]|nr:PIN domain-containing protein [Bacteroidales bacterium]